MQTENEVKEKVMSLNNAVIEENDKKSSILDKIKLALAVILMLLFILAMTAGVLYLTNKGAKTKMNEFVTGINTSKAKKTVKNISVDTRVSELADYFLTMDVETAGERLISIKKDDKKVFAKIQSSMDIIDPVKSSKIANYVKISTEKANVLQTEYEKMKNEKDAESVISSDLYKKLGVRGSIDHIEEQIKDNMDYDKVAGGLSNIPAADAAKILYYINPAYAEGIKTRFPSEYLKSVDKEVKLYSEFLRENKSYAKTYNAMEEKQAAKELENPKKYNMDQLAAIFSNMEYLNAAKILNNFEDPEKVSQVLKAIKSVEDYQVDFEGSLSTVITNSIKVLKKYDEDVDILCEAYKKMNAEDLAEIMDKLINQSPTYKTYIIDSQRQFKITEKDMAIKALKQVKPKLVGDMLAVLKNTDRVDKAAIISKEIGIPQP